MPKGKITTELEQDKVCKSSKRFKSPKGQDDKVTTSIYIQNAGMDEIGNPTKIKVTVEPA